MYNFKELGEYIRERREERLISRERLAEECELSDKSISNIELGLTDPRIANVLKICRMLDIYTGDL